MFFIGRDNGITLISFELLRRRKNGDTPVSPAPPCQTHSHGFESIYFWPIKKHPVKECFFIGRDNGIRTHDLLLPKQALYQAELYPGRQCYLYTYFLYWQQFFSVNNFF